MKSKMKIKKTVVGSLICLSMIFSVSSCAGDGFDKETFSGGVTDTQLQSPDASEVAFSKLPGTTNVKVTWPVVMGAGGYQFSLYIVDNPDNPVAVVKDSIIDGSSVVCPYLDDTNYKAEIKTLGNEKLNNTDATSATETTWTTLISATSIPDGEDLVAWFANNPVTTGKDTEVAFELEAGGTYTISGDLDFGVNNVQLRGNKLNHAKVNFTGTGGSIITCGGGLALKFIDFDCSVVEGGTFLKFGDVPAEITGIDSYGMVTNPIIFQSCEIRNVKCKLVNINNIKYAVQNLIIRDCIVEAHQVGGDSGDFIDFNKQNSFIKDLEISSSTFYSHTRVNPRFLRYSNGNATKAGWTVCTMTFKNNTFYNISYNGQSFNCNSWTGRNNSIVVSKNLFIDSFSGNFNRRIRMQNTNVAATYDNNCYWYNGALPLDETTNRDDGDKSTSAYGVDPVFTNPANGDFTPSAPEVFSHGSGDPRWLN